MRIRGLAALVLAAGCSAPSPPSAPVPNAFEVDAKGAPAVVDRTLTLDGLGQPIGAVLSMARCGDMLMFSDSMGQVRRMELSSGRTLPSIAPDASNEAMAVDCEARLLYVLGDPPIKAPRNQRQLQGFNIDSGVARPSVPIDLMMLPHRNAVVLAGDFIVGGTWRPIPLGGQYQPPSPASFFSDKKLGLKVSLASGESEPLLPPYEASCRANCAYTSLAPVAGHGTLTWVATQASSKQIAFYDAAGTVQRRFDVTSPLFADTGEVLRKLDSEADVRWSSRNSLVRSASQFGKVIATVHFRSRLPEGWTHGQSVEFDYWMNLHDLDGRKLVSDIRLPGMPIGHDDTHLYVTDYGANGRHSAPDRLKILRIPVKSGTEGFQH